MGISPDAISSIVGMLGGVAGGIGSAQQQKWINDFAINLLNRNDQAYNQGWNQWQQQLGPQLNGSQMAGAGAHSRIFDDGGVGGNYNAMLNNLWQTPENSQYSAQRTMKDYGGALSNDQFASSQQGLSNLAGASGRLGGIGDLATQAFQNGGWTPQRQSYLNSMTPLMEGMSPSQKQQLLSGMGLMQNGGANSTSQKYMDRGGEAVDMGGNTPWLEGLIQNVAGIGEKQGRTQYTDSGQASGQKYVDSGGYDPAIQQLMSQGMNLLSSGGRTPQLDQGSSMALEGMGTGGQTATTRAMTGQGLDYFGREALMSPEEAESFAADTSGRASKGAFEAMMRQAKNRGGGAGANVAAGNANGVMADFADQIAENKAKSIQDALLNRQSLGLQQNALGLEGAKGGQSQESDRLGMFGSLLGKFEDTAAQRMGVGANVAGSAANTAANKMGTGASLLNAQGQLETQRYLQALGLVPTAQNSATNRAGTIGGLGMQADSNNNQRLNTGANLLQGYTGSQQNAGNSMNQFIGNQDQYQQMLAALGINASNSQGSLLNNLGQNELASLNGGTNRANVYGNQVNNQMNNTQAYNNMNAGVLNNSWNSQNELLNQAQKWGLQGLSNLGLGAAPKPGGNASVWSSALGGLAGGK